MGVRLHPITVETLKTIISPLLGTRGCRCFAAAFVLSSALGCADSEDFGYCPDSSAELQHVTALGVGAGSASPRWNASVVAGHGGDYFVAPSFDEGTVSVFGPAGALKHVIGRHGSGPGEFRTITTLARWPGDSIAVLDRANGRLTIMSGAGALGRSIGGLAIAKDLAPIGHGRVAAYMTARSDRAGPIWVFDPDGKVSLAFGEKPKPWMVDVAKELTSDGLQLYAASRTRFEITVYDETGKLVQTFAAAPEWFPGFSPTILSARRRMTPDWTLVSDIAADSAGVLWLLASKLSPDAKIPPQPAAPELAVEQLSPKALDADLDYYLQGVDVQNRCMVPAKRLRTGVFTGFGGSNVLVSARELDSGEVVLDVWRILLSRP